MILEPGLLVVFGVRIVNPSLLIGVIGRVIGRAERVLDGQVAVLLVFDVLESVTENGASVFVPAM